MSMPPMVVANYNGLQKSMYTSIQTGTNHLTDKLLLLGDFLAIVSLATLA